VIYDLATTTKNINNGEKKWWWRCKLKEFFFLIIFTLLLISPTWLIKNLHAETFRIPSKRVYELIENWDFNTTNGWKVLTGRASITSTDSLSPAYSLYATPILTSNKIYVFDMVYALDSEKLDVAKGQTVLFGYNIKLPSPDYYVSAYAKILYEKTESLPPGGGCPYVLSWDGSEYVIENNILPQSEDYFWPVIVEDYYVLQHAISSSSIKVKIVEFEREKSFIYSVSMYSIVHPKEYYVTVDSRGKVLFWTPFAIKTPSLALNDKGEKITGYLKWVDELAYEGRKGESIIVTFRNITNRDNLKLIIRADLKTIFSLKMYVLSITGKWIYITTIHPRELWAFHGVDLAPYGDILTPDNITIKIVFTSRHKIDFVGLDTAPAPNYDIRELPLVKAWHSRFKNVKSRLSSNKKPVIIIPGDELYLEFSNTEYGNLTHTVTYVLKIRGWYTKASKKEIISGKARLREIDPTYVAAEAHLSITGNASTWYEILTLGTIPSDATAVKFEIVLYSDKDFRAYIDVAKSKFVKQAVYSDFIDMKLVVIYADYWEFSGTGHRGLEMFFTIVFDASDFCSRPYRMVKKWGIEAIEENTYSSIWLKISADDCVGFDSARGTNYKASDVVETYRKTHYNILLAVGTGLEIIKAGITAATAYSIFAGVTIPYLAVVSFAAGVASLIYTYYKASDWEGKNLTLYDAADNKEGSKNRVWVYVPSYDVPVSKYSQLVIFLQWEKANENTHLRVIGKVMLLDHHATIWQKVSIDIYY